MTSGCVSSPAATATAAHRTAARFQPGQNAHQPGSAVVNQPGTPAQGPGPGGQERRVGAPPSQRGPGREPGGQDHDAGHGPGQAERDRAAAAGEAQPGHAGGPAERPPGQVAEARAERRQHHHGADGVGEYAR